MIGVALMLRIEVRRSAGLLFFPLLLLAAFWVAREYLPNGVALWNATAYAARQTIVFLGPLMAGLAAWTAGRSSRRGMGELLESTPRSAASRDLTTWAALALWGVLAYAATAAILSAVTYPRATWGSPPPLFLAEGLLALLAHSAIGYAVGYYLRSRFVAPLIPVALYIALAAPEYTRSSWRNLSPVGSSYFLPSVFYSPDAGLFLWRAGLLAGLAAVAAAAVILRTRRTPLSWLAMVAAVVLTGASASALLGASPGAGYVAGPLPEVTQARRAPYEPVCEEGRAMQVCVHPAYEALLPRTAEIVNRVAAPLTGIPGAPTRAEQLPELESWPWGSPPASTIRPGLEYDLLSDEPDAVLGASFVQHVAHLLTVDLGATPRHVPVGRGEYGCIDEACEQYYAEGGGMAVQDVVAEWLWRQADYQTRGEGPDAEPARASSPSGHVRRFMELDPAQRREWLAENFADLRAGKLTVEDLP